MSLLPGEQMAEACEPLKNKCSFENGRPLGRKLLFTGNHVMARDCWPLTAEGRIRSQAST